MKYITGLFSIIILCFGQDSINRPDINKLLKNMEGDTSRGLFKLDNPINIMELFPNENSDPYIKPLFPHEIDAILKKSKEYNPKPLTENDIVIMETQMGHMKLKLFSDIAPEHSLNFKKLANSGFYDGTTFHRIIPNFMIQGGDILSRDANKKNDGTGNPGWTVNAEFNKIEHKRGILSMARSADPNSAGSQFFICVADAPHLNGKYTAFVKVIDNIDIIDNIVNSPTDYSNIKKSCKDAIPKGQDPKEWVTLIDPKTRKKLFARIPAGETASSFSHMMSNELKSDNPTFPIRMTKVRVIDKTEVVE